MTIHDQIKIKIQQIQALEYENEYTYDELGDMIISIVQTMEIEGINLSIKNDLNRYFDQTTKPIHRRGKKKFNEIKEILTVSDLPYILERV